MPLVQAPHHGQDACWGQGRDGSTRKSRILVYLRYEAQRMMTSVPNLYFSQMLANGKRWKISVVRGGDGPKQQGTVVYGPIADRIRSSAH